jgi:hypothetical protein
MLCSVGRHGRGATEGWDGSKGGMRDGGAVVSAQGKQGKRRAGVRGAHAARCYCTAGREERGGACICPLKPRGS